MPYFPRGFISSKNAIRRLVQQEDPTLGDYLDRAPERQALQDRAQLISAMAKSVSVSNRAGTKYLHQEALTADEKASLSGMKEEDARLQAAGARACRLLREALAEGELTAHLLVDGHVILVSSVIPWRNDDAPRAIDRGWLPWRYGGFSAEVWEGAIAFEQAGLEAWISRNTEPAKPEREVAQAAAVGIAKALKAQRGQTPSQGEVIEAMVGLGFESGQATAAASKLPADLKRKPGDHARRLARLGRKPPEDGA